jgi:WD40 repeat protein
MLDDEEASVTALAALSHGRVACGSDRGAIKVWNTSTAEMEATITVPHASYIYALCSLPDGRLASGGEANIC